MRIGKQQPYTAIATSDSRSITVRGKDLCSELIGEMNFADFYFFLLTGERPTTEQSFFVNAALVTIAEHGLTPTAQAARMTYDADPAALQGAVAAGILGAGSVVMGTAELCGRFLHAIVTTSQADKRTLEVVAMEKLVALKQGGKLVPGYGHPLHSEGDPRTARLLSLARERRIAGKHVEALLTVERLLPELYGRRLPANASAAIPAVLLEVDFPLSALKGIPILARTAGLLGHLHEEMSRPIGFLMYHMADEAIAYDGPAATSRPEPVR